MHPSKEIWTFVPLDSWKRRARQGGWRGDYGFRSKRTSLKMGLDFLSVRESYEEEEAAACSRRRRRRKTLEDLGGLEM